MNRYTLRVLGGIVAGMLAACLPAQSQDTPPPSFEDAPAVGEPVEHTPDEWRARLTPEQFRVLRESGTERAFSGAYWDHHAEGVYRCAGCGAPLYASDDKFDSGTGWPSFTEPIEPGRVGERRDESHGMVRVEIVCASCGGHLGHVFPDGPEPTGMRHCVNSASLAFDSTEGLR